MVEDILTWHFPDWFPDWVNYSIPNSDPLVKVIGVSLVIIAGILGSWFVHRIDVGSS